MNRVAGTPKAERRAAEDAVCAAPRNPDAWLSLGATVQQEAHNLRRGRFADSLSADEWRFLNTVYPLWARVVARATELDPQHEAAWTRLARAATFSGDRGTAEEAFGKAESLSANKYEVYTWGLQMFQQKWGGEKSDLDRVAAAAARADYWNTERAAAIANELREAGYPVLGNEVTKEWTARADRLIAKNPDDPDPHWNKAYLLYSRKRMRESCREYETVAKLLPNNTRARFDYAEALYGAGDITRAITEYQKVLQLDPQNISAPIRLGGLLQAREKMGRG